MTAANASRTYGASDPAFSASYGGFVLGQTLGNSGVSGAPSLASTDGSASPVGSYPITVALGTLAAQNYIVHAGQRNAERYAGRAGR